MDAVITAGGIPQPGEPLYELTQGKSKALLDVAGKSMIQWVVDALEEASSIENVLVVGLDADNDVTGSKLRAFLPNQGGLIDNIRAGVMKALELNSTAEYVLLVSSDIPAITAEIVDWATKAAIESRADLCYNVITREVMEARYPTSNRTFLRLKDQELCGGDMNVVRTNVLKTHDELWDKLIEARKSPLKQASIFGLDNVLLLLLRRLSIEKAVQRVSKRLGLKVACILCPYAEIGMDVDKPGQLELLRASLSQQHADVPGGTSEKSA